MKPINTIDGITPTAPSSTNIRGLNARLSRPAKAAVPPTVWPDNESDEDSDIESKFKVEFQDALIGAIGYQNKLTDVAVRMLEAGIDRDTALEWGLEMVESGKVSESHVRSTISRIWGQIDPRKAGSGRKADPDAQSLADHAVRLFGMEKAEKMCLAASRLLHKANKAEKANK
ncbi:MAG: hypothetical protein ACKO0Z_08610 [Betaproteobacteria bacterium]